MTTNMLEQPTLAIRDDVLMWRAEQLVAAGYKGDHVLRLAERSDIDLHLAARLLRHGCPAETAVRILL